MNSKLIVCVSCCVAVLMTAPVLQARGGGRGGGGGGFSGTSGAGFSRGGMGGGGRAGRRGGGGAVWAEIGVAGALAGVAAALEIGVVVIGMAASGAATTGAIITITDPLISSSSAASAFPLGGA